jgi:purine-binding chemotaxis protein CheW
MTNNSERNWDDAVVGQSARQVQLVHAGSSEFGIFADEIAGIVNWREPTPLPGAPASVLGVVSVQGRMLTVLDLAAFPHAEGSSNNKPQGAARQIVALKGDEQLALAVDEVGEAIVASENSILKSEETSPAVLGILSRENSQTYILNTKTLFPAAIQGRERRRRRF